jgi:Ca2+ transporting ATPase
MTGEAFKREIGDLIEAEVDDNDITTYVCKDKEHFIEIVDQLRVLARATAEDKLKLVAGLKAICNKNVAVTGDGINDVDALMLSDVGMTMNSGAVAAKDVSSIILTENDFEASLRAVMWGRNIFHNISRFIQFQVTVNISVLVTIFVGIILFANSPLNAVQLLWINLIMDTFAALSLSTEPPLKQVIKGKPYKDK